MSGALVQLVATGNQDTYLTQHPTMSYFMASYRQYTNFAMESIQQTFSGTPSFGNKAYVTVSRSGDLVHKMYLELDLPALTSGTTAAWVSNIGHSIIDYIVVTIGGTQIDKHYGEWLYIWNELTLPESKKAGYDELTGNTTALTTGASSIPATTIYVPLEFWFNRHAGLSLPLLALAYQDVKLEFSFNPVSELVTGTPSSTPTLTGASVWVDYIFLDKDERTNVAQQPHEYLIEQLQFTGAETVTAGSYKSRLSFNHPSKELIWCIRDNNNMLMDFSASGANSFASGKIQLNGNDRFSTRDATTFNLIQPFQHHTRIPAKGISVYSFALYPEDYQPSGTLNFSRIDNATLVLNGIVTSNGSLFTFCTNYNVLRVLSGMGGLAYNS